jgi:hypothetical protein
LLECSYSDPLIFSEILAKNPEATMEDIDFNPDITQAEISANTDELYNFAKATLEGMIEYETRRFGAIPSLSFFCRMDIGLIEREDRTLCYFVNEVERTSRCSFWSGGSDNRDIAGLIASEFTNYFPLWLDRQSSLV